MSQPSDAIIVCGMPKSGTTILTACLAIHPGVQLFVGGKEWDALENDLLLPSDPVPNWREAITACCESTNKRPLFKRPWIEKRSRDFWEFFEGATVLATYKDSRTQLESWARHEPDQDKDVGHYNTHYWFLGSFKNRTGLDLHIVDHNHIASPHTWRGIGIRTGLDHNGFDLSLFNRRWRRQYSEEFCARHAINISEIYHGAD